MSNSVTISYLNGKTQAYSKAITLPASKSISNRLLLLQHLYFPDLIIQNLSDAHDTVLMQRALKQLSEVKTIDVEDAGTVARFVSAAALFSSEEVIITGTERMQERPMNELIDALEALGARFAFLNKERRLPFKIKGLSAQLIESAEVDLTISTAMSSQFLSALLMIAPRLNRPITFHLNGDRNSWGYIEMTIKIMRSLGFKITESEHTIMVEPHIPPLTLKSIMVEQDWSSAAFLIEILSYLPKKTRFTFKGLQSILKSSQGDAILCAWAQDFNLIYNDAEENIEFEVVDSAQQVPTRSFKNNPDLVLPYLMSMVLQKKKFDIYDVASLQYKESDRMLAIEIELSKCQVVFKKTEKGYTIDASKLHVKPNMFFDSHNDHRIAMCLAPLAFHAPIAISNPNVVNKSFPKYWDELRKLNFEVINS